MEFLPSVGLFNAPVLNGNLKEAVNSVKESFGGAFFDNLVSAYSLVPEWPPVFNDVFTAIQTAALPKTYGPPSLENVRNLEDFKKFYYDTFIWFKQFTPEQRLEMAPLILKMRRGPLLESFLNKFGTTFEKFLPEFLMDSVLGDLEYNPLQLGMVLSPATMEWNGYIRSADGTNNIFLQELFNKDDKEIVRNYSKTLRGPLGINELYQGDAHVELNLDEENTETPFWSVNEEAVIMNTVPLSYSKETQH